MTCQFCGCECKEETCITCQLAIIEKEKEDNLEDE